MLGMLLILAAQASAPDSQAMMNAATKRLSARPSAPVVKDYRIADDDDPVPSGDPTSKDRAFADNGSKCAVVGARRCTSKPRTIFSRAFD